METILIIVFVIVAIALIGLVLIQHGKGADAGAAFGSGASATVFGASGSGSFLSRTTGILAAIFFALSLALANISSKTSREASVTELAPPAVNVETPAPVSDVPEVKAPTAAEAPKADAGASESQADVLAAPAVDSAPVADKAPAAGNATSAPADVPRPAE